MSSPTELDAKIIDAIVCKVKSEGLFDQFRRECLADVDTKPAFQNVQQRVETAVSTFLDGVEWTSQLNKNQLREKLRKSINNDASFEAGIQRIVDQVVNPKLNSNLVPKIQDVAYKFLGIEKPLYINLEVKMENDNELPLDLEQVDSPESDNSMALDSHADDEPYKHNDDKYDDLDSPAFEPMVQFAADFQPNSLEYSERQEDDMDISDGDDVPLQMNGSTLIQNDEAKSNLSSISGLTSSDSQNEYTAETECKFNVNADESLDGLHKIDQTGDLLSPELPLPPGIDPELSIETAPSLPPQTENSVIATDISIENINQDSVLSQVSSTSRLSIITNNNTTTRMDDGDSNQADIETSSYGVNQHSTCPYGISEEAQMQKFNDSSSSNNSLIIDTDNVSNGTNKFGNKTTDRMTRFDINRQDIKFEGTSRKSFDISENSDNDVKPAANDMFCANSMTALAENEQSSACDASNFEKTGSTKSELKHEYSLDMLSCDAKSSNNLDTEDSKPTDDSSSSNHRQPKDLDRDGETSSCSRDRNDGDHHSHRSSRDRSHHSSSKDRRRDRDKDRKSSSSKDATSKSARDESESTESTNKHRDSIAGLAKHTSSKHDDHNKNSHRKSSSSRDKSRSDKHSVTSSTSSNSSNKREHSRHPSSSNSKDKDISKRDSKSSDSKRNRFESSKSTSSKKDDHYTHKEKSTPRQRSRSKDSNDGNHRLPQSNVSLHSRQHSSTDRTASIEQAEAGSSTKDTQPITSHTISTPHAESDAINSTNGPHALNSSSEAEALVSETQPDTDSRNQLAAVRPQTPTSNQEDEQFVMATQPVCVDQILTGKELNLEVFIDENRDDPVVSSIEQTLEPAIRKPKVAANIFEARKLSKKRKEMELDKQKKVEKATVLAKQYIQSNASGLRDDSSQGIELEFVCTKSNVGKGKTTGPTISSPIKYVNGVKLPETKVSSATAVTVTSSAVCDNTSLPHNEPAIESPPTDMVHSSDDDMEHDFYGFNSDDIETRENQLKILEAINEKCEVEAKATSEQLSSGDKQLLDMLANDDPLLFLENNKMGKDMFGASKLLNRKRKVGTVTANSSTEQDTPNDMIVANVVISQTNSECVVKPDSSTRPESDALSALEKQRQKTRYSNDDLFKPRPVLSSGSRSRRRGYNCNE